MKKIHLKPIEEVYPNANNKDWSYFDAPYDYRPMVESMAEEVLLEVKENDYSGYSRFLLKDKDMYGYLMFGWGSCSGCDALLACNDYEQIHKLRKELYKDIRWGTKEHLLKWIKNHDWEGDAAGNTEECKEFTQKAIVLMSERILDPEGIVDRINDDTEFNKEIQKLIDEDNELMRKLVEEGN